MSDDLEAKLRELLERSTDANWGDWMLVLREAAALGHAAGAAEERAKREAAEAEVKRLSDELDHATADDGDHLSKASRRMVNTVMGDRDAWRHYGRDVGANSPQELYRVRESWKAAIATERARTLAEVVAWLRGQFHSDDYPMRELRWAADAIESGAWGPPPLAAEASEAGGPGEGKR